jgi:hypothetical protein
VIIGALAESPKIDVKKPSSAAVAIEAQTALRRVRRPLPECSLLIGLRNR